MLVTQEQFAEAVGARHGVAAADRLCEACVELLDVGAVAISIVLVGEQTGTLGVSSPAARIYDEVSFTLGEGPCLDAVATRAPVIAPDLSDSDGVPWAGYGAAMLGHDVRSVWSMPLVVAGEYVGALTTFTVSPGAPTSEQLAGALLATDLAGMPLLDVIAADKQAAADPASHSWTDWSSLTRAHVNQATGMLIAQLGVNPVEALARLRAHAFATDRSASDIAHDILERNLLLDI